MLQANPSVMGKLRQAFAWGKHAMGNTAVAQWAKLQGLSYEGSVGTEHYSLAGTHAGKNWVLAAGAPTRDFILGNELTACAHLKVADEVAVLIMSRPLKDMLEKKAFDTYTDTLQTAVDVELPMEMRWLAAYEEECWAGLPREFWNQYAVIAGHRCGLGHQRAGAAAARLARFHVQGRAFHPDAQAWQRIPSHAA